MRVETVRSGVHRPVRVSGFRDSDLHHSSSEYLSTNVRKDHKHFSSELGLLLSWRL